MGEFDIRIEAFIVEKFLFLEIFFNIVVSHIDEFHRFSLIRFLHKFMENLAVIRSCIENVINSIKDLLKILPIQI